MSGTAGAAGPQRRMREVLGRFATGVAIVTTRHLGRPVGVTVNSFASLSLDPPLVLWCLGRSSGSRAAFTLAEHFAVHILASGQRDLALRFAGRGDRFEQTPCAPGPYELPLLEGAVATLVCRRRTVSPGGDHLILTGEVLELQDRPGAPLLFLDGGFHPGPSAGRDQGQLTGQDQGQLTGREQSQCAGREQGRVQPVSGG